MAYRPISGPECDQYVDVGDVDVDATTADITPRDRNPHRYVVHEHRQRVDQGLQQRRLSVLRNALSHVHRAYADLHDMYVHTRGTS